MSILLLFCSATFGQTKPDDQVRLQNPISRQQVIDLPNRERAPQLKLNKALRIAEEFIKKERIDISHSYLFEARLISGEGANEDYWMFWWVGIHRVGGLANDLKVRVSMNAKPERLE